MFPNFQAIFSKYFPGSERRKGGFDQGMVSKMSSRGFRGFYGGFLERLESVVF